MAAMEPRTAAAAIFATALGCAGMQCIFGRVTSTTAPPPATPAPAPPLKEVVVPAPEPEVLKPASPASVVDDIKNAKPGDIAPVGIKDLSVRARWPQMSKSERSAVLRKLLTHSSDSDDEA